MISPSWRTGEVGRVLQHREVAARSARRRVADRRLQQPRRLDRAAQLLGQRDAQRVRHAHVQRELQLPRPVRAVDRAHRRRRRDRAAERAEVDDVARPRAAPRRPRVRAGARAPTGGRASRMRAPRRARRASRAARAASSGRRRAGRAVVLDEVGVDRRASAAEARRQLGRVRRAGRRAHLVRLFGVGCSMWPSSSACSLATKRSGSRSTALDLVRRARRGTP